MVVLLYERPMLLPASGQSRCDSLNPSRCNQRTVQPNTLSRSAFEECLSMLRSGLLLELSSAFIRPFYVWLDEAEMKIGRDRQYVTEIRRNVVSVT